MGDDFPGKLVVAADASSVETIVAAGSTVPFQPSKSMGRSYMESWLVFWTGGFCASGLPAGGGVCEVAIVF